ncbi:MAG: hypothetical protein ACRYGO_09745 [Janthinobacterium lividum]
MNMLPLTPGWMKRTCAILAFGALVSPDSLACYAPPRGQVVTPQEQIAMATDVSVARVVRATPSTAQKGGGRQAVEYEFEVVQRILGPDEARFVLVGAQGETRTALPAGDHRDEAFWQRGGGRLYNDTDCVLRPNFVVGESYLVFRDKPATRRSFEHIETVRGRPNPDDKWLSYVVERLGSR